MDTEKTTLHVGRGSASPSLYKEGGRSESCTFYINSLTNSLIMVHKMNRMDSDTTEQYVSPACIYDTAEETRKARVTSLRCYLADGI